MSKLRQDGGLLMGQESALESYGALMLDGVVLPQKDHVHSLGILLDWTLPNS